MKKKHDSAIKFLAGALAAVVLGCMVSVNLVKPQKVQADTTPVDTTSTPAPGTISMSVADLTLPVDGKFTLQAWTTGGTGEPTITWGSSNQAVATVKDGEVTAVAHIVSGGAVQSTMITAQAKWTDGSQATASCLVIVNPKISSPVSTTNTPPTTPTTPSQPTTPDTPTQPTEPVTPSEPTQPEPDKPDTPAPGPDTPPVTPDPAPVETAPPADTVITGVIIQDDGTVIKNKVLVTNAIVDDNGTKYITDGAGKKIVNKVVTTQNGTMYGTLADGRVAWSATFVLGGKKYYAAEDGVIAVKKFSTTPYDHKVYSKADGTLVSNKVFKVNGKRYYARKSGAIVQGKWVKVGNKKYYCNKNGVITKSKKA